ncbi:protein prune homolog 2-like isoform X2 [Denticeps clupeoides]|uniref:protein prune homolog 2-like isoform X2 n=1 Tax=Denticeps clupeoides TaxID=299321 RepID=UPI0010A4790F|nr:protein prune homolog 2-like isoform X2 [Denticeps clupeoides]
MDPQFSEGPPRSDPDSHLFNEDLSPTTHKPAPPTSLFLSESQPRKKHLVAPVLSLSLEHSESVISDDFPEATLSPAVDDEDLGLDIDLDAIETPSDSESLHFPPEVAQVLGLEDSEDQAGVGPLEQDEVDCQGCRWRRFRVGDSGQETRVDISVLEPYLGVLSHGGYYGDGANDIIVFSSCHLPENTLENYQYIMDNLFSYLVGTLDLMVAENYLIVYLCGMTSRNKLPTMGWLRECYSTIDRRLRKNLKGFYIVHPTWYIKALITIIKPFISSKFSQKLQFVDQLQELSRHIPMDQVQIPDCVRQYDHSLDR